jgi:excisionase family DNA binding protein
MEEALDILTLLEAAKLLRCSKAHVCNLVNGKIRGVPPLPTIPLGRRILIRRSSLYAWIGANEQPSSRMKKSS